MPATVNVAAILLVCAASLCMSSCPDASWTAAPASTSSSWTNECYKSTTFAGSSLVECFDACLPGRPACLSSPEESRFIIEHVPFSNSYNGQGSHWIGEHRTDVDITSLQCDGAPSAPWLSSAQAQWVQSSGTLRGCSRMVPLNGYGSSYTPSDGADVYFGNGPCDGNDRAPCLCATSSVAFTSSAKSETLALLTAKREEIATRSTPFIVIMIAAIIVLVLLPFSCICLRVRSSRYAADATGHSDASDTTTMLRDASSSAARVRLRVSGALFYLGWCCLVLAFTPLLVGLPAMSTLGDKGLDLIGDLTYYMCLIPWGLASMLLAILPTDVSAIRCVPFVLLAFFFLLFIFMFNFAVSFVITAVTASVRTLTVTYWAILVAWWFQSILLVINMILIYPTIRCCCCKSHQMTPRAALNRMWLALRCEFIGLPVAPAIVAITDAATPNAFFDSFGLIVLVSGWLLAGLTFTPANRGRIRRFLGSLGAKGSSEQEAAAIAALVGGRSPAETLSLATSKFRMITTDQVDVYDLASSKDTGLYARTKPAALGECAAFLSHSWRDDSVAKHAALSAWSDRQKADERTFWLDKACIDQNANIDDQLVALPIFLSGCKELLIIAGPTYTSRLWCTMEVFTFVRMNGGQHQGIVVEPIGDGVSLQTLADFDGGKAQCFDPKDRSHLLAVIESGMGDIRHFNRLVGAIFIAKAKEAGLVVLSKGAAKGKGAKKYQVGPEPVPPVPPHAQ